MKPEERVQELFSEALEQAPTERVRFLDVACVNESEFRQKVDLLLFARQQGAAGFGDYELLGEIARGGMGVVYKARQISLNRVVALKMILAGQFANQSEVKRFYAEAEAAANLDHPNIVTIHEVGVHQDQHYFSMQYIEGRSLAELGYKGTWQAGTGKELAQLVAKIARAVQYAHDRGILHRDLKPANILVDAQGEPHVSDFGLARQIGTDSGLTMHGAVLGTPSFMAPEQAAGKTAELSPAADIYGLGAILYFLLTGRPPFAAASPLDTLVQVLEGEVIVPRLINPRVARDLEQICLRCLAKGPERRYKSAGALAEDLERFMRGEPVHARPGGLRPLLLHWMRRQPALASRLVGLGLCLIIAQVRFQYRPPVSLAQHWRIMAVLMLWALFSAGCQRILQHERWSKVVPFIWVAVDSLCLTVALWLDDSPGPLLASFPALIVASGLWFRAPLVGLTTVLTLLGYSFLIFDVRHYQIEQLNWHPIFLVLLGFTGCSVAYQVHRVRSLSRFYNSRP